MGRRAGRLSGRRERIRPPPGGKLSPSSSVGCGGGASVKVTRCGNSSNYLSSSSVQTTDPAIASPPDTLRNKIQNIKSADQAQAYYFNNSFNNRIT
jgi:hypothetical protein